MFDPMPSVAPRLALGTALPTVAASLPASSADANPKLTELCAKLAALEAEARAIHATRHTTEDEERTEPQVLALYDAEEEVVSAIMDVPLRTVADL